MPVHTGYQQFKDQPEMGEATPKSGKLPPTPADIEGPFFLPDAPLRNKLVDQPTLYLAGTVRDTEGYPVDGATLEFWQANEAGEYDLEGFHLRCRMQADGFYTLATIRPGNYQISEDESRCAHIHVKAIAPGCKPLTTQLYFADDPHNRTDRWFKESLVIDPTGRFDFVLERETSP